MNFKKLNEFVDADNSHLSETIEELINFYNDYKELDSEFDLNEELIYQIEHELELWLKYYENKYIIVEEIINPPAFSVKKLKIKQM